MIMSMAVLSSRFAVLDSIELALPDGEVQIWRVALDLPISSVERLRQTLAADEIARAGRFRAPASRDRFVAAHGLLRHILGQYLDTEAAQLQFCYGPYGKPFLAPAQNQCDVRFSLSHSHGLGLFAFARGRDIGVDLEYLGTHRNWERIARHCLSASEQAALYALPARARRAALLACWARKEAYLKGTGRGLTQPLNQIEIGVRPGDSAAPACLQRSTQYVSHSEHRGREKDALNLRVLCVLRGSTSPADALNVDPRDSSPWSLVDLAPGQGYLGALAVEGQGWRLAYRHWLPSDHVS
jgi:4'-phosphopantetheinyl transferase